MFDPSSTSTGLDSAVLLEQLRAVIESARDYAVIMLNTDGDIAGWSTGAVATFGWPESNVLGQPFDLIWTAEDRASGGPGRELKTAKETGYAPDNRWHVRADGNRIFVTGATRPVRDAAGELTGFVKVCRDETDRRRSDEEREALAVELRRNEAKLRALLTASADALYRMSPDWAEMRQLQGGTFLAETGEPSRDWLSEYVHPDDQPRVTDAIAAAIQGKSTFNLEHRVYRSDGRVGWVASRAVPLLDEAGEIIEWFGAASDVTERHQVEEEREHLLAAERAARAAAEQAGRMKDEFLATLSHELRTPLNAIVGWAQILKASGTGPEDYAEGLAVIDRNARAQTQIIEDILDMSRIIAGKLRLDVQRVDLAALVRAGVIPSRQRRTPRACGSRCCWTRSSGRSAATRTGCTRCSGTC